MASLSNDPKGLRRIQFIGLDGRRKTIRLGRIPKRDAEAVKVKVEQLLACKLSGCSWDAELAKWVADIPRRLADKLTKLELMSERDGPESVLASLGVFLAQYVTERDDVKSSTATVYGHTRRCLVHYFGADRPLISLTAGDAGDWRRWLSRTKKRRRTRAERQHGPPTMRHRQAVLQ